MRALQRMECPYRLEPHQMSIQGMDCIHIFPVVQWLVNKSIEFRAEYGEKIKQFAVRRFNFYHPNIPKVSSFTLVIISFSYDLSLQSSFCFLVPD